jgi:hypothetical protein
MNLDREQKNTHRQKINSVSFLAYAAICYVERKTFEETADERVVRYKIEMIDLYQDEFLKLFKQAKNNVINSAG